MDSIIALLSNPSLKRALVAIATAATIAINKKLGLQLEVTDIVAITTLAVAFITQSAMKQVKLAGVDAAAKVVTPSDAAAELSK